MAKKLYEKLVKLIFRKSAKFPNDVRIFVVSGNNFVYVNDGQATAHMSINPMMKNLKKERGSVLDALAKFEFVVFELLRFSISGADDSKPTMEVVKALSPQQRINVLKRLKIIDDTLQKKLSGILQIRNAFAHKFNASEVVYKNKPVFHANNFIELQKDLQKSWDLLMKEYATALSNLDLGPVIKKISVKKPSNVKGK